MKMKENKGFTLVEVMVVVSILAILATAYFWNSASSLQASKVTLTAELASTLNKQVQLYRIHSLEAGEDYEVAWTTKEQAVRALKTPIPGTDIVLTREISGNQLGQLVWDNRPFPEGQRFVSRQP